jgi:peptidyl-prolyl cis-trans isomerase SurA
MIKYSFNRWGLSPNLGEALMNRRRVSWTVVTVLMGICFQPCFAGASTVDRIVAIVNGDIITESDLKSAAAQARLGLLGLTGAGTDSHGKPSDSEVLDQLIDQKIQLQLAEKKGVTVGTEELTSALNDVKQKNGLATDSALEKALLDENFNFEQYKNGLKEQITILKLVNREVKAGVVLSDQDILAYYEAHSKQFLSPMRFRLHQIVIPVSDPESAPAAEQTARDAIDELKGGADFEAMVRKYSSGPETANHGDLGLVRADDMLPEIRLAVESLKPGGYSAPVRMPAGIHIFRLDEAEAPKPRPIEEVKGEIKESLFQQRSADLYEKWLKDLRAAAQVEIKY